MPDEDTLQYNATLVSGLRDTIKDGKEGLDGTPKYIRKVLNEKAWQIRVIPSTGEVVEFDSFTDFVEAHPPEGLGTSIDMLKRMCEGHDEVRNMLLREVTEAAGPAKGNEHSDDSAVDNINSNDGGTSESYALRRLKRDAPELAEKVLDGEMSANAAAIEAGFRTKTVSVPVHKGGEEQHERAAKSLAKHFNDVRTLIECLQRHA